MRRTQVGTPPFFVVTHSPPNDVRLERELGMRFTFAPDLEDCDRPGGSGGDRWRCRDHGRRRRASDRRSTRASWTSSGIHLAPLVLGGGTPLFRPGTRQRYRQREVRPSSNAVPHRLRAVDQRVRSSPCHVLASWSETLTRHDRRRRPQPGIVPPTGRAPRDRTVTRTKFDASRPPTGMGRHSTSARSDADEPAMNRSLIAPLALTLAGAGSGGRVPDRRAEPGDRMVRRRGAGTRRAVDPHRRRRPPSDAPDPVGAARARSRRRRRRQGGRRPRLVRSRRASSSPGRREAYGVLAYPALFVATIGITSDRRRARDLLAGSEPIIYVIALTALVWLAVTGPYLDDGTLPLNARGWIWVFPLLDGLLALIVLRRTTSQRPAPSHVPRDGPRLPGVGRGPCRRRMDRVPGRSRTRHAARGGHRRRPAAARDLRYPARHPSPDRRYPEKHHEFTGRRSSDCCSRRWYRSAA